jgi:hypothetical protein
VKTRPRAKKLKPLEKVVQAKCDEVLRAHGCRVFRRNAGMMFGEHKGKGWAVKLGEPGAADLFGELPDGRHFECEVKRDGERPRLDQVEFLRSMSLAWWVDDADELDKMLPAILAGGRIEWGDGTETYPVEVKTGGKRRTIRVEGPTAEFWVVEG